MTVGPPYTFNDLYVGQVFRSPGRTITEADVVAFAGLTGDYSELHTNDVYARNSQFGRRVAHGMLGLSFAHGLMWARTGEFRLTAIAFLGISDWRFLGPIFLGDTIFVGYTIESLRDSVSRPTQAIATFDVKVTNQDGVAVQAGKKALLLSKIPLAAIEASQVQGELRVMMSRFNDEVAVVTGSAQGIGAGIADRLAQDGARVVIADINETAAKELAASLRDNGLTAMAVVLDVSEPTSYAALTDRVAAEYGQPYRYLVCNAGVQTFASALELITDEWDRIMAVNARGTFLGLQEAGRAMPDGAAIVSIASIQGRLAAPNYAHYAASKAAILSLTKSFALALAPRRIRVNSVAPGIIETPLWDEADRQLSRLQHAEPGVARAQRIASVPLGRAGKPEDVAAAVSFLLSDDASYITGECIHVCGGDVML